MPADYQTGKVYKITSPNTDQVYIGSTVTTLSVRFANHVSSSKKSDIHTTSRIVITAGNASIELIENFPCESKTELERREGEVQKITANCCNKNIAGQTRAEYRADHKEEKAEINKKYKIAHADEIAENKKKHYAANKDKICEQKQQYRATNKEAIDVLRKAHYAKNRDKLREQQRQRRLRKKAALAEAALAQKSNAIAK